MSDAGELWEMIGELKDEETAQVLTRLYCVYDDMVKADPKNPEAALFFKHLENAISFCTECNLNRR